MKKERHNFNRDCRLDMICNNDFLRTQQSFIYFKDGYAYATNAHILVKVKLSEISTFQDAHFEILENKAIHKSVYAKLLQFDRVEITPEGFKASVPDADSFIQFGYANVQHDMVNSINKVIADAEQDKQTEIKSFGINPVLLNTLNKLFHDTYGVELIVKAENKPIFVKWSGHDALGLIMPVMINN
jgi:hypothetical protein